jgi:hypothetical protein
MKPGVTLGLDLYFAHGWWSKKVEGLKDLKVKSWSLLEKNKNV